jgi:tRNA-specific 2-thiouridylase
MSKQDVRAVAERANLPTAHKPESQEICFIPDGDYARFIERYLDEDPATAVGAADASLPRGNLAPGSIVSRAGEVLGSHDGIHHYTVGQRKGIGVSSAEPLYVIQIDAPSHRVVVGSRDDLLKKEMLVGRVNWISVEALTEPMSVSIKIRSRAEEALEESRLVRMEG